MLRLRDIMTRDVVTVSPDISVRDAMELFSARHISGAPVVENGRVIGVVSTSDLLDLASRIPAAPTEERPDVEGAEQESGPSAEDQAWAGAEGWVDGEELPAAFFRANWDGLPPEDQTDETDATDEANELAGPEWAPLDVHTVREAMTEQVVSLSPDTEVGEAADLMQRLAVHRILVMDGDRLAGLVTALDVAEAVADHRITARRYVFGAAGRRDERDEGDDSVNP